MSVINVLQFRGYSKQSLYEYLQIQECTCFEIELPKIELRENEEFDTYVLEDYTTAAYAGQLFSRASATISYLVPHVMSDMSFVFYVHIYDLRSFANELHKVVRAYAGNAYSAFLQEALDFIDEAYDNPAEAACFGLLEVPNWWMEE